MPIRPSIAGGHFALDVAGSPVAVLKQFSGLGLQADIADARLGGASVPKKHVANVRWTPGRVTVGMGMGKGLSEWMQASLGKTNERRDGSLKLIDLNQRVTSSLGFTGALITEVTFPRLDATSKEAAYFDVAFQPEQVVWTAGAGEVLPLRPLTKPKAWLAANFKIRIGDLPCARVVAVESFTWRCAVTPDTLGSSRPGTQAPATVTVPDLLLSISVADQAAWAEAAKKWFIDGKHLEADEMSGRITFLGPSLADTDELGSIDLLNVGFKRFTPADAVTGSDQPGRFTVGLYVEQMVLNLKAFGA